MSFSLVAGACCIVKFSYSLAKEKVDSSVTLNINSTGAKKFSSYNRIKTDGCTQYSDMYASLDTIPLVVYNGTTWINSCYAYYADYQD